jgi:hypothetical protein
MGTLFGEYFKLVEVKFHVKLGEKQYLMYLMYLFAHIYL